MEAYDDDHLESDWDDPNAESLLVDENERALWEWMTQSPNSTGRLYGH